MQPRPTWIRVLEIVAVVALLAALGMVFFYAPMERVMGQVQRVFYFHVASNWIGMLSFAIAALSGIAYLISRKEKWDRLQVAAVELGLVFSIMGIISGSIWARPIWNTWWTWDPRLVSVTIMVLVYFAYLMLRQGIEDPERRARFAAVYAVLGFLSVPLTFFSIRLFRTIHPQVIGKSGPGAQGTFDMTPEMVHTLIFSVVTYTILYVVLLWHRNRLEGLRREIERRKARLESLH